MKLFDYLANEILQIIKLDILNAWSKFCLFVFNIIPDLYVLRLFSNIVLRVSGCKFPILKIYIRKSLFFEFAYRVRLGRGVFVNRRFYIEGGGKVVIGDNVQIGPGVYILTTNHKQLNQDQYQSVTIGNNVWIGASTTITPGCSITDNVVIAAGAVVAKSILEPGLWGGVPARKIR